MLKDKIIQNTEIESFIAQNENAEAARLLLELQKQDWKQCADGYASLDEVLLKEFLFDGFKIKVQYNPGRVISSTAKTDDKSISERDCFLCYESFSEEQKGILFLNEYLILCNPYPVFREHFVLTRIEHLPQRILNTFSAHLSFAKSLSKYYTVIYNGPECGASAPDHLHFQAGIKNFMPIDTDFDLLKDKYGERLINKEDIIVTAIDDGLRKFFSIESNDKELAEKYFAIVHNSLPYFMSTDEEPMLNLITLYADSGWRILIFPREKHRPWQYFKIGEENITLSPASVDMGGACILPFEKDFNKITKEDIIEIFNEVMITDDNFKITKEKIKK